MSKTIPVFTPTMIQNIENHCNLIYSNSRKKNVKDRKKDTSRSGKEINLQGIGAEIWFKELHGIPYELLLDVTAEDYVPRNYKNDIDVVVNGMVCEIKQTSYPTGCFFISHKNWHGKERELLADVYVLVIGSFPFYDKALYLTKDNLVYLNPEPRMHPRIGQRGYYAEQEDMHTTLEDALKWKTLPKQ